MTDEPILGYCVKCREKREIASPQAVFMGEQSRPATKGTCPVCGTNVTRFGRTPAHEGLDPAKHTIASKAAKQRKASGPKMVIVESPAKARTVGRFLGRGYSVEASVGHIRDLPANRMGVDVEQDFEPRYVIPSKKKEVVKKLRARAQQASELYLATDPDREGEAIAWHVLQAAKIRGKPVHRVTFHEITPQAVKAALAAPGSLDMDLVNAQQARRVLDRLVGYQVSPVLWKAIKGRRGLSAGRVQTVALRLVVDREREIEAFVPVEYWSIEALLAQQIDDPIPFWAQLWRIADAEGRLQEPDLKNRDDAEAIVQALENALYWVERVDQERKPRYPPPPFTTSTMQQAAAKALDFTPKLTMRIAQQLYEGIKVGDEGNVGLITYMRTDSTYVAPEAQAAAREVILRDDEVVAVLPEGDPLRYALELPLEQLQSMRVNLARVLEKRPTVKKVLEAIIEYKENAGPEPRRE